MNRSFGIISIKDRAKDLRCGTDYCNGRLSWTRPLLKKVSDFSSVRAVCGDGSLPADQCNNGGEANPSCGTGASTSACSVGTTAGFCDTGGGGI